MRAGSPLAAQYCNVDDFGLMYYNARWYDPALGRFAQADTVVPPGPQGYDRYAYVGNNPVNNVDPSGHKPCTDTDENGQCVVDPDWDKRPAPQPRSGSDPTDLTGAGARMQAVYVRLAKLCGAGAWWHPDCSRPFTLREFMILVLSGEFAPFYDEQAQRSFYDDAMQAKLATAAANWFSDSCIAHGIGCEGPTPNALLNWMGENLESGMRLFDTDPTTPYPGVRPLAEAVVDAVLSVSFSPSPTGFNDPVHWGNASYYTGRYNRLPAVAPLLAGGDAFYVVSYADEARMCGQWPCP